MNESYNAVIVGQTGVGKSTLINYLYGQNIVGAGLGKPVTKNGFHPINFILNGLPVTLYDSWGLEVGKWEEWMAELTREFEDRGVDQPANKWFHSVFYCIQAGSHRIQDCDIQIIKAFMGEHYKVSVILTKADYVSADEEDAMRNCLHEQIPGISVIAVCSESKIGRMSKTEQFGKEKVEQQAYIDFFDSLIERLPLRCKSVMEDHVEKWAEQASRSAYDDVGAFGFNASEAAEKVENSAKTIQKELCDIASYELNSTLRMYGNFSERLGYPPPSLYNDVTDSYERFKKQVSSADYAWWETSLMVVFSPIIVAAGLCLGRDSDVDAQKKYISDCKDELNKDIYKITGDVRNKLYDAKCKVINESLVQLTDMR